MKHGETGPVSRDYLRRALELANLDAVRMALYHNTGRPEFAALPLAAKLGEAQRLWLIEEAVEWLASNAGPGSLPEPTEAELRELLNLATGEEVAELEFEARRELPAFKPYPFMTEWAGEKPDLPEGFKVAIIGSGFSGIVMGVQCELLGIPYVVIERQPEPGGTWNINRYPEVRVDTISITYEFSFEKAYRWKEYFGKGEEVRAYLDHVSKKFGVRANTLYSRDLQQATFDETRDIWTLELNTPDGPETIEANVVVTATGLFANPKMIEFEGQEKFKGRIVHPARWPADLDLTGKRVAIFGNGSTGVQMLKAVAQDAEQTYVFQRTPQWIMPRDKYGMPVEPEINWLMDNFPGYWNWWRYVAVATLFNTHSLVCTDEAWKEKGGLVNPGSDALRQTLMKYIEAETGGRKDLIDRVTPDYAPYSRRPVVDNGWYRALTRDDVELVTDPVARLTPEGIETADGKLCEVDVIITATGFDVVRYLAPAQFAGREGLDLHDSWAAGDGPRAYIGMMVPRFPNLFMMYGPNSQPVSSGPSQSAWFTIWASFIGKCITRMLEEGHSRIEVSQEAFERYNAALDVEAKNLVAMTHEGNVEKNYYVNNEHGRLQVNAPWYGPVFQRMFTKPGWEDLQFSAAAEPALSD